METITIELKHANAKKLLKELEEMDIIKVVEQSIKNDSQIKPSKLRGFLSKEKATALLTHVDETRKEWEKRFPTK
jgi:Mg/Co/Ni transporter MgtE